MARTNSARATILRDVPLASWLFIKDKESIWIERPYGRVMIVAGPGARRDQREFLSEDALQAYQIALAERLTTDGWFLWGVDRERRAGAERRRNTRGSDRRRAASGKPADQSIP
jgi:hypothetical protein